MPASNCFRAVLCAVLWTLLPLSARAADTLVIVLRHAEKATEPAADPDLSTAGLARAQSIARRIEALPQPLAAVYTSQYLRTRRTAEPAAQAAGVVPQVLENGGEPQALAERIRTEHRGQLVLVVGHSNTVGPVLEALGAPPQAAIAEQEFDRWSELQLHADGTAELRVEHY